MYQIFKFFFQLSANFNQVALNFKDVRKYLCTITPLYALLSAIFFICVPACTHGQHVEFIYKHFDVEDGLPSSTIYCTFQDSKGFIWFGTSMGLTRFDGKNFKTFTTKEGLPDNEVFRIYEDEYNRLWLICFNAYPCYIKGNKVYNYDNSSIIKQIQERDYGYSSVFADTGKTFWLIGSENMYHVKKDTIVSFPVELKGEGTVAMQRINKNIILLSSASLYSLKENSFTKTQQLNNYDNFYWGIKANLFINDTLVTITQNAKKIAGDSIITYIINKSGARRILRKEVNTLIYSLTQLKNGDKLATTANGVLRLNHARGEFLKCPEYDFLKNKQVTLVYEDTEGNLWFSTLGSGIYMVAPTQIFKYNYDGNNQLISIFVDSDTTLYLGKNNAHIVSINANRIVEIDLNKKMGRTSKVSFITKRDKEHLIFGSDQGAGTYRFTNGELKLTSSCTVKSMEIFDDTIYLGINSGIVYFTQKNHNIKDLTRDTIRVTALNLVRRNEIWYGTLNGLRSYHCSLPDFGKYNKTITTTRISGIEETNNGAVFIASSNSGLFVYYKNKTYSINEETGLSSNLCKKIFVDDNDRVWVCTAEGVDYITNSEAGDLKFSIHHYNKKTGMPTNDINDVYVRGNTAWLMSPREVYMVNLSYKSGKKTAPIYLLSLMVSDSLKDVGKPICTDYNNNNIEIVYAGLLYSNQREIKYKYILDGADNDTVFTDLDRVNFSSLAPGKYVFYVWAQNPDGQWSDNPASVSIQVTPPFWQTWWFRITISSLVIGGIILYFRRRISRLEKEQNLLRRIDELELMALKSQMNPHFVFNSLNSIQSFVNKNDSDTANRYLSSFGKLIRQTLDFSSKQEVSVEDEAGYLKTYLVLEKMRFGDKFDYFISIDENYPGIKQLQLPSLILQPYVENAIRHGLRYKENGNGILNINFYVKENILYCEVDDNGIGRMKARELKSLRHVEYQSRGMDLSGNRVDAINRLNSTGIKLNIIDKLENGIATGTLIQLLIPLQSTYDNSNNS
jgi:sugar lactone lactonase YvrE